MNSPHQPSEFFHDGSWQNRFDDEFLHAAAGMGSKVKNLHLQEVTETSWSLTADCLDAKPTVEFWCNHDEWEFETFCTCDHGTFCVHAAAAMLKASKEKNLNRLSQRPIAEALAATMSRPRATEPPPAHTPTLAIKPTFELWVTRHPVDRHTKLLLQSLGQTPTETWICAEAIVVYGEHRFPLRSAAPTWVSASRTANGQTIYVEHDEPAENRASRMLSELGLSSLQTNSAWRFLLNQKSKDFLHQSPDRWFPDPTRLDIDSFWHQFRGEYCQFLEANGWTVNIADAVGHRIHEADPDDWQSNLSEHGGGWFALSVGFDVEGETYDLLPILAKLLESDFLEETLHHPNSSYVYAPLPNGDALKLPAGRVRKILHHLAALMDPKFPERTRLHALDAAHLAGLSDLGVDAPADLHELADKLKSFDQIDPVNPPPSVQATLRDYQLTGFRWMQFLARHGLHGILADDMGLGKTLQTLTHIQSEKTYQKSQNLPTLVVAPTSVVPNWRAEAKKFTPDLRVLILNGPERKRYFRSIPHADLVLTSYALLHRDIEQLRQYPFHLVVLDEAQHIKNPRSQVAQAATKLDSRHRLCLSGTPIENHLGELWSLMKFLIPGFLGSEDTFNSRYRKPIEKNGDRSTNDQLKQRVAPLILRRNKDQVAKELPPKTELIHLIELNTAQKDLYETVRATMNKRVRDAIAARGGPQFQIVFLDALLKLRQICCDPQLLPDDFANTVKESAKLKFLTELIQVLVEEGRRILLFSQFTSMLSIIENHLKQEQIPYLILTGSSKNRGELVEAFQTGKIPLFLISLKAGGTGLNLTAADTVIHYDPWWNPAAENQATDRAYRIGQKNPVFVHKLLCQDTVEQRIHQLQQEKSKLAEGLLEGTDQSGQLDAAMIRSLLEP